MTVVIRYRQWLLRDDIIAAAPLGINHNDTQSSTYGHDSRAGPEGTVLCSQQGRIMTWALRDIS